MAEADRALERRQFAAAEAGYQAAMLLAMEMPSAPVYRGVTANNLGRLHQQRGAFLAAEKHYRAALAALKGSAEPILHRRATLNLASLYLETGQISKTAGILGPFLPDDPRQAIAHPDGAVLLSNLGVVRMRQNRLADAERLFRIVIDGLEDRRDGETREIRANAMSNLSEVLARTGRLPEATGYCRRAVQVLETASDSYPGNLVKGLANLAVLEARMDDPAAADTLFRKAIALSEQSLGADHPLLGSILNWYAVFLHQVKRKSEARKIEQRAGQILARSQQENLLGHTVEYDLLLDHARTNRP